MLELAVLGVLKEAELHGYELKKRLREVLGPLSRISFGSLYPALARMERAGLVKAVEAFPGVSTIPATGSFAGEAAAFRAARRAATRGTRGKKVYGITEAGETRLAELLTEPAEDERGFALQLAFCRWADPATRLELLTRRRALLAQRLHEGRRTIAGGNRRDRGDRPLDRYVRSLLEHDTESTERDIAWLDRLIAEETSSHDPHTEDVP